MRGQGRAELLSPSSWFLATMAWTNAREAGWLSSRITNINRTLLHVSLSLFLFSLAPIVPLGGGNRHDMFMSRAVFHFHYGVVRI